MIEYMRLCQKYQLHLLSDEIYALTTFATPDIPNPEPFTSLLSIDKKGLIDPSLCHVLHGMSKECLPFQCANYRTSVLTV
jgi:aspartate/methionine/tyrosine aminotransferase